MQRQRQDFLADAVGHAQVAALAAELDFDRVTTNSEEYNPDNQVVRSTQTVSESSANSDGTQKGTVSVANNLPESQQSQSSSRGYERVAPFFLRTYQPNRTGLTPCRICTGTGPAPATSAH